MSQAEIEGGKQVARQIPCLSLGRQGVHVLVVAPNLPIEDARSALLSLLIKIDDLAQEIDTAAQHHEAAPALAGALCVLTDIACRLSEACDHG